jgi:ABC-type dipeptide/oligopeptide/nickel transport system permease subunit
MRRRDAEATVSQALRRWVRGWFTVGICGCAGAKRVAVGIFAPQIAPYSYDRQFRDDVGVGPSHRFPMGTDEIGRDRFSRLLYATRVSVLLAPAAAIASILLALAICGLLKYGLSAFITVCLSLPWLFLFIILRAELPLNTGPAVSVALTFGLMGMAGWAWPARVFTASIGEMKQSDQPQSGFTSGPGSHRHRQLRLCR